MPQDGIPDVARDHILGLIEELYTAFGGNPLRWTTTLNESGYIIAHNGLNPCEKEGVKKISMTINPLLYIEGISPQPQFYYGKPTDYSPVSYTKGAEYHYSHGDVYVEYYDTKTGDMIYPSEFEVALYCTGSEYMYMYLENIEYVRFARGVTMLEGEKYMLGALQYVIQGRTYARYTSTLLSRKGAARALALHAITGLISPGGRVALDLAYLWDEFWIERGYYITTRTELEENRKAAKHAKIYFNPDKVMSELEREAGYRIFSKEEYQRLYDSIRQIVEDLYDAYTDAGVEVATAYYTHRERYSERALSLHLRYLDLFPTPQATEAWLKWVVYDGEDFVESERILKAKVMYTPFTLTDYVADYLE